MEPIYGQAMHGGRNQTSDRGRVLGLHGAGLITIKGASAVYRGRGKMGQMRAVERVVIGEDEERFFQVGA